MRGVDTDRICSGDPFGGIKDCLWNEGCGPSGGGCEYSTSSGGGRWGEGVADVFLFLVNCGADAPGYAHGGVNVGLGCTGDRVKRCIDQSLGISGNTDYVCNITG